MPKFTRLPKHITPLEYHLPIDCGYFIIINYDSYTIIRKNPQSGGRGLPKLERF